MAVLRGWKEIAAYLRISVGSAKRRRMYDGLPVYYNRRGKVETSEILIANWQEAISRRQAEFMERRRIENAAAGRPNPSGGKHRRGLWEPQNQCPKRPLATRTRQSKKKPGAPGSDGAPES